MGGHPYYYVVPYQQDVERALAVLRENEFRAGRYYPAMPRLTFGEPGRFEAAFGASVVQGWWQRSGEFLITAAVAG